jgi:hypothetical protein
VPIVYVAVLVLVLPELSVLVTVSTYVPGWLVGSGAPSGRDTGPVGPVTCPVQVKGCVGVAASVHA